ncbi:MAG: hypothetical protein ACOCVM_05580 [Desulfovibrionaceae bacterium]
MRVHAFIVTAALLAALSAGPALAAEDYSSYSTEELSEMRGTLRSASDEDRAAFQDEWTRRTQSMTPEERRQYLGPAPNAAKDGQGSGAGQVQGRGRGKGDVRGGQGRGPGPRNTGAGQ